MRSFYLRFFQRNSAATIARRMKSTRIAAVRRPSYRKLKIMRKKILTFTYEEEYSLQMFTHNVKAVFKNGNN
jgi:hypothetical protein